MAASKDNKASSTPLSVQLSSAFAKYSDCRRCVIALSGGEDSMVLAHLLSSRRDSLGLSLVAIHVNHGLHAQANAWQEHCEKFCAQLDIPFIAEAVQVEQQGKGIEAEARKKRYAVFQKHLQQHDLLLTGHHQQDQAETLLLNLFRGAGIKGLAAMPEAREFGEGILLRPLLGAAKHEISEYAEAHRLKPIEDPSNQDEAYRRNFLRHSILPALFKKWPSLVATLTRSAGHIAEAAELLNEVAAEDVQKVQVNETCLDLTLLSQRSNARQKNLIRHWLKACGVQLNTVQLASLFSDCIHAKEDAEPLFKVGDSILRRYRDRLFVDPLGSQPIAPLKQSWNLSEQLSLPELGMVLDPAPLLLASLALNSEDVVEVAFRQGGEQFKPVSDGPTKSLKNYFQEQGLPPWQRDLIPLIYHQQKLVAVWGCSVAKEV